MRRKIGVVSVFLSGQEDMQDIVKIIVPLCLESLGQQRGVIVFVFQQQMHTPITYLCSDRSRHFHQPTAIVDGVHGIQPQTIKPE